MAVDAQNIVARRKCGKSELKTENGRFFIADLTSDDAKLLLEAIDLRQRGVRARMVLRYRRDMAALRHRATTPICISAAGTIFDGQHRMHAHAELPKGTRIQYLIFVANEEHEKQVRATIDTNAPRNVVDVGRLCGSNAPAVLLRAYMTEMGNGTASTILTRTEVPECVEQDKVSRDSMEFATRYKKTKVPQMAAYLRCARKDLTAAQRFWSAVFSEQPTVANDAGDRRYNETANTVIRYLANTKGMHRAERREIFAKCIFAFNAWRRDESLPRMPSKSIPVAPEVV